VIERRSHLRLDKVFTVYLSSAEGVARGVGRNISARGMFIEASASLPLGSRLRVTLCGEDGTEMSCLCDVRYQVVLSFGGKNGESGHRRGMGLKIVGYEMSDDGPVWGERVMH
jgi:hypothetical protein